MLSVKHFSKHYAIKDRVVDLNVGYSALRISLPLFVAQQKNYFKRAGLNVRLKRFDTAQSLMRALEHNELSLGGYIALPIMFDALSASDKRFDMVSAMVEDKDHRVSFLIRGADQTGIQSITDLKSKTVGVLPTTAYKQWLSWLLKHHGVNEQDVTVVPVNPLDQAAWLQQQKIDALFTNDPMATTVLQQGGELVDKTPLMPEALGRDMLFGSMLVERGFKAQHSAAVDKFIAALDKSIDFIHKHPAQAKQCMRSFIDASQRPFVKHYPNARYLLSSELSTELVEREIKQQTEQGVLNPEYTLLSQVLTHSGQQDERNVIFDDVSLSIKPGDVIGLFGPNGSGKSTLLDVVGGLDKAYQGAIEIASRVAYVHQKVHQTLLPWKNCKQNILLARSYHKLDKLEGQKHLAELIEKLGVDFSLYAYPHELSGGQKQLVVFMRALLMMPQIFLIDEGFSAMDAPKRERVIKVLAEYREQHPQTTIIFSSHRGIEISSLVNQVCLFTSTPVQNIKQVHAKDFEQRAAFETYVNDIRFNAHD